jgi:hypothetical protein
VRRQYDDSFSGALHGVVQRRLVGFAAPLLCSLTLRHSASSKERGLTELLPTIASIRSYTLRFGVVPRSPDLLAASEPEAYLDLHEVQVLGSTNEANVPVFRPVSAIPGIDAWLAELKIK